MGLGQPPVWDQLKDPAQRVAQANQSILNTEKAWLDNAMARVATNARAITTTYTVDMKASDLARLDQRSTDLAAAQAAQVQRRDGGIAGP